MSPQAVEILLSLCGALAAGLLVGAEREQGGDTPFGGIRTFPLIALSGALGMLLGPVALAVVGLAVVALLGVAYVRDSARAEGLGLATEVAAIVTFALGASCTAFEIGLPLGDRLLLAAAGATVTFTLLTIEQPLHRVVGKLRRQEVFATAKLLILAVLVLPLLPDEAMGPWAALNPRRIGLLAVLVSAIGFAGYVAMRVFGSHRGSRLTGVLGGLVSSTAVTVAFAGRARSRPELVPECAIAILLASTTLFPRVVLEVAAVSPGLAARVAAPAAAGALVMLLSIVLLSRGAARASLGSASSAPREPRDAELELGNPFSVRAALGFALLLVIISLVSHGAALRFSVAGLYASSALAGLADVDAISLSVARLHERGNVEAGSAATALAIAVGVNTLTKLGLAAALGTRTLAARVCVGLLAGLAAGAIVLLATA